MCCLLSWPEQDQTCNSEIYPDWELNWQPFALQDDAQQLSHIGQVIGWIFLTCNAYIFKIWEVESQLLECSSQETPKNCPYLLPGGWPGGCLPLSSRWCSDLAEQHLRDVEKDVLFPQIMREKTWQRRSEQFKFYQLLQEVRILTVIKCWKENSYMKNGKMEYLKEREEFRKTGIPAKKRLQKLLISI